jgi:ferredoxin
VADPGDAWDDNVGGEAIIGGRRVSFYVDRECILCRVCTEHAPDHFALSADEDHDVVTRQPRTLPELAACEAALADCPVEAIGDDG